ncbi:rab-type small G protein, partial [Reticulomyxa filosa]
ESFEHVDDWLNEVNRHASDATLKLLIGNKADLNEEKRVSSTEAQSYANKLGISFLETSAKNAANVDSAFLTMAKQLIVARFFFLCNANIYYCPPFFLSLKINCYLCGIRLCMGKCFEKSNRESSGAVKTANQGISVAPGKNPQTKNCC